MAGENTVATLNGLFKEVYADKLEVLTPSGIIFQKDIQFVERQQQPGNNFHQPVLLAHEHGFSYAAAGAGAFTLNAAVAGQTKDAYLTGTQMLLRSSLDYESAARAKGGVNCFKQAVGVVVENMWESSSKRSEIDILWGTQGIGVVSSLITTTGVVTITTASWAPGIWAGMEGAILHAWAGTASTAAQVDADLTITAVDVENKKITVSGVTSLVATNVLYFKGQRSTTASTHNVYSGLHAILANSGSLFGIDASAYSLWKSTSYDVGGALSFGKVQKAIARGMGKGLDEDVTLYINPGAWADLVTDEAALRRHTDKKSAGAAYEAGAEGLKFYSQNGVVTIKSSIYIKEGFAFLIAPKLWKRVGATDLTFRLPDRGDEFFRHLADSAGYELRCYLNNALFSKAPGKAILLTGIVNST
jgi:hypothetical protein